MATAAVPVPPPAPARTTSRSVCRVSAGSSLSRSANTDCSLLVSGRTPVTEGAEPAVSSTVGSSSSASGLPCASAHSLRRAFTGSAGPGGRYQAAGRVSIESTISPPLNVSSSRVTAIRSVGSRLTSAPSPMTSSALARCAPRQ